MNTVGARAPKREMHRRPNAIVLMKVSTKETEMTKRFSCVLMLAALAPACTQGGQQSGPGEPPPTALEAPATSPGGAPTTAAQGSAATATLPGGAPRSAAQPSRSATPAAAAVGRAELPKPQFREVTLPVGTTLSVKLETPVSSATSRVEDAVRGSLAKPIVVDSVTVVPEGAAVAGSVTEAVRAGKVKGRASIAIRFRTLTARGEKFDIRTARIARSAASNKGDDAKKVGIGAGAGALIGAIAGGGKGAAIGGAVGAGAGTGVVVATRGDEVGLAAGVTVSTTLQEPLKVLVPVD